MLFAAISLARMGGLSQDEHPTGASGAPMHMLLSLDAILFQFLGESHRNAWGLNNLNSITQVAEGLLSHSNCVDTFRSIITNHKLRPAVPQKQPYYTSEPCPYVM
jgi:hypothetical protein